MKKTRFTEEQMVTILREADQRPVPEVAKKNGVSAQTLYAWRKHFGTLEPVSGELLKRANFLPFSRFDRMPRCVIMSSFSFI